MTIYELLQADHQTIRELLAHLSETSSDQTMIRRTLFARVRHELLRHAQTELDVFYAALLEQGADKELVFDAIEDHAAVTFMIGEVETFSVHEEGWFEALMDLSRTVQRHFRVEEDVIFKKARKYLTDVELAQSMLEH